LVKLKTDKYLSLVSIVFLITLGAITAVFFRSPDISFALSYLHRLFGMNGIEVDLLSLKMALYMVAFLGWEWYMQDKEYQFDIKAFPKALKFSGYYIVIFSILLWGHFADRSFIYFHF
jgi:hypothetical protein